MNSELHVADLEISGFMVAVQHVSRVGFLDTGLQKTCFMAGASFRLYNTCYIAQSWLS